MKLVLLSGGIDSTSLLYGAYSTGKGVVAATIFYGQKHDIELDMAKWQAKKLGIKHIILDLSSIFVNKDSSALLSGSSKEIEHTSYAEQLQHTEVVSAYVPYRNGLFLSVAASLAYQLGCDEVWYGAHADDAIRRQQGNQSAAYPDCTIDFIEAQRKAIIEGTAGKVNLIAPLANLTKAQVVAYGIEHGATREVYEHTHSCYEGIQGGCGTCGTCIDARAALDANELTRGVVQH